MRYLKMNGRSFSKTILMMSSIFAFLFSSVSIFAQEISDLSFTADFDQTEQNYIELLPEDFKKDRSYDLMIALHGYTADRWQFARDKRDECVAFRTFIKDHNLIGISPDYRCCGSWMNEAAEQDLLQIIRVSKEKFKIGKVFLIGGSMGGASVLTFAALHPDLISGVVSMNGLSNYFEYKNFQEVIEKAFGGKKAEIPLEYKKRSAEYWPEKLTMPIAFTVGMRDTVVPPSSIIRLVEVLKETGVEVKLIADEGGHETDFKTAMEAMDFVLNKSN